MISAASAGRVLLTIVAGGASGLVVALVVSARMSSPAPLPSTARAANEGSLRSAPPGEARSRLDDERLAAIERRMARLDALREGGSPPREAPPDSPRDATANPAVEQHLASIAAHQREARDARWAPGQEREVSERLSEVARDGGVPFSLVSVDCRTSTCVARLRWSDEGSARAGKQDLMRSSMSLRCARQIYLEPPAPGGGSYEMSMYIDCSEAPADARR